MPNLESLPSTSPPTRAPRRDSLSSESLDRAQHHLDSADVIVLALDMQGRITLINRKGCDILGWTEAELLGRDWLTTCLPPHVRQELHRKLDPLEGGDLSIVENPVLTKSGEERLIEWHNTVLRDETGVIGTFSLGVDITAPKRDPAGDAPEPASVAPERGSALTCAMCGGTGCPVLVSGAPPAGVVTSVGCEACGHFWEVEGRVHTLAAGGPRSQPPPTVVEESLRRALRAAREHPGVCPGYLPDTSCGAPATVFQYLMDDPTAYCETHARQAALFWDAHGFPPAPYIRLSSGKVMKMPVANRKRR